MVVENARAVWCCFFR